MIDDLHAVTGKIIDMLEAQGCWYETFHHQVVGASEEAAAARPGYGLNQGAKAIILRVKPLLSKCKLIMQKTNSLEKLPFPSSLGQGAGGWGKKSGIPHSYYLLAFTSVPSI